MIQMAKTEEDEYNYNEVTVIRKATGMTKRMTMWKMVTEMEVDANTWEEVFQRR